MKTPSVKNDIYTSGRSETFEQGLSVRSHNLGRIILRALPMLAMAFLFCFAPVSSHAQLTYAYPSTKYCPSDPPTAFSGHITHYTLQTAKLVNCSMSYDQFDTNYYGAINQYDWIGSAACGACVSLKGPSASVTLKIVDQCPYSGNESWCYSGSHHIDCSSTIANAIGGDNPAVTWTFIECPLSSRTKKTTTGNVNYIWKYGSSQYWGEIAFFDYLFPIVSVKHCYQGTWNTCTRQSYNFFACTGAGVSEIPGNLPATFALFDARNNSITITTGSSASPIQSDQTFYTSCTVADSGKQFASCNSTPVVTSTATRTSTSTGPTATFTNTFTPTYTSTLVPCTSINDFETGTLVSPYTNQAWSPYAYGGASTITAVTCAGFTSTYAMQFGGSGAATDGSAGWGINNSLGATMNLSSTMSYIRFDIRVTSAAAASMRFNVVSSSVDTSKESNWGSNFVAPTSWTSVTLTVGNFDQTFGSTTTKSAALAVATAFQFQINNQSGSVTLQIDNICLGTTQATSTYTFTPTRTSIVTPGTYCPYPYANFDNGIITSYFSNQPWYPYTYGVGVTTAAVTCAGANSTVYGMQFGGSGATTDGVSGWGIANGFGTGVTTNLSTISGISFWIRSTSGAAVSMRFNVVSGVISTASEGNWGGSFVAPTAWTCVTILSSAFDQTYTKTTPTTKAAALAAATGIQFQDNNQTGSITIQIDEINLLYSGCTPTATFTRTPTITPTSAAGGCWSVDNFDDGNLTNSFTYSWNTYTWSGTGTTQSVGAASLDNSTAAYSGYSLYWVGTCSVSDGSDGFGCEASLGGANVSSYFQGLNFYVKTSRAATFRVQLNSASQSSSNGSYGETFATTTGWTLVNIPLASFTQEWGTGGVALSAVLANINMIQWVNSGNAYGTAVTVWLDNVCITSSVTPTMSPTWTPSRTFTITPTTSNTGTNTATPVNTNTFTRTNTPTYTTTSTPTPTASYTSTPTKTNTPTNTSTATNTANNTSTFTWTRTSTPTNTLTATQTNTPQFTYTYSNTPTNTATRSYTPSLTPTRTNTATSTPTWTLTSTLSPTFTNTGAFTGTFTSTNTSTPTKTATPTSTNTSTPTLTRTNTVTSTPTWTLTSTLSPTFTNTGAFTGTFTSTGTSTSTSTSTPTKTATPTNTTGVFTSTFTASPTFTSTSTRTSTPTNTNTASVNTPTYTSTYTRTSTPTRTWTPTNSFTATWTGTPTVTSTFTISYTPVWTVTGTVPPTDTFTVTSTPTWTSTATRTGTPSFTVTNTRTSTPTNTNTTIVAANTSTWTSTPTRTSTPSATSTYSLTRTYTVTATSTATITSTPTDTFTGTLPPTNTFTWTGTPTNTFTETWTPTSTATFTSTSTSSSTATVTWTNTPLFTYTNTSTPTNTSTHTWTGTSTPSSTNTVTASYTTTATSTSTPTWTDTFTNTNTFTVTPTTTSTWTYTYTSTPTVTATSTNTFTYTPTHTPTATSTSSETNTFTPTTTSTITLTQTHTPVDLKCRLIVSAPYPNPVVVGQTVKLMLSANPNCPKKVTVAVYSAAYRKIYESTVLVANERGIWEWSVVDFKGAPVASGVYYLRVEEEGIGTVLKWSPVVVLR